jgi:hypothetical protein
MALLPVVLFLAVRLPADLVRQARLRRCWRRLRRDGGKVMIVIKATLSEEEEEAVGAIATGGEAEAASSWSSRSDQGLLPGACFWPAPPTAPAPAPHPRASSRAEGQRLLTTATSTSSRGVFVL